MKPRIYLRHGIWSCISICRARIVRGFGYTPFGAWLDWTEQCVEAQLKQREAAAHPSAA